MSWLRFIAVLSALVLLPTLALAQARQHVIQGRVTSDSGAAIPAADVIVTIAPSADIVDGQDGHEGSITDW